MQKDIVVLGLGNPLMADEGIGVEILLRLSQRAGKFPAVEFVDAGTAGLSLLHKLSCRRKAVLIDCCAMGSSPGSIAMFRPEEVDSVKRLSHFSLHEVDILHVIELARRLGDCPGEILIFGVEPAAIEAKQSLSAVLAERLDSYVELVAGQLRKWA
jgi:hydrogenase maturation protease